MIFVYLHILSCEEICLFPPSGFLVPRNYILNINFLYLIEHYHKQDIIIDRINQAYSSFHVVPVLHVLLYILSYGDSRCYHRSILEKGHIGYLLCLTTASESTITSIKNSIKRTIGWKCGETGSSPIAGENEKL